MGDTLDYAALTRKAMNYAKKRGYANEAEDFAQTACLYAFEHSGRINLKWVLADYLRAVFGDVREHAGGAGAAHLAARATYVWLDDWAPGQKEERVGGLMHELVADPHEAAAPDFAITRAVANIRFRNLRDQFILEQLSLGFRQKEIAERMGVSRTRVCQLFREMKNFYNGGDA